MSCHPSAARSVHTPRSRRRPCPSQSPARLRIHDGSGTAMVATAWRVGVVLAGWITLAAVGSAAADQDAIAAADTAARSARARSLLYSLDYDLARAALGD